MASWKKIIYSGSDAHLNDIITNDITASSLSIRPNFPASTPAIEFSISSSGADGDVPDGESFSPLLLFGGFHGYIGHKSNLNISGIPKNRIFFNSNDDVISVGNSSNYVNIQDQASISNTSIDIQGSKSVVIGTSEHSNIAVATASRFEINTPLIVKDDITTTGNIIAQNYIISSSVSYMTQSFSSGSTIFGDTVTDTHQFTGSINAGDITGSAFQTSVYTTTTESIIAAGDASHQAIWLAATNDTGTGSLDISAQVGFNYTGYVRLTQLRVKGDFDSSADEFFKDFRLGGQTLITLLDRALASVGAYKIVLPVENNELDFPADAGSNFILGPGNVNHVYMTNGVIPISFELGSGVNIETTAFEFTFETPHTIIDQDNVYIHNRNQAIYIDPVDITDTITTTNPNMLVMSSSGQIVSSTSWPSASHAGSALSASYVMSASYATIAETAANSDQWFDAGTELTSSASVGITGSLTVHGDITASSLSIAPDGTDMINFGLSSSYSGEEDVYDWFPILRIGATTDSFIGHGQVLDAFGIPRNRIKFEKTSNTICVGNSVSRVLIEDSDVANSAVTINSQDFVIRNYYGAADQPSILRITESRANFSGDVQITGSLYVSESVTAKSFTGSLHGTASYALNAGASSLWFDANTELTSSVDVGISGSLKVHGDITASSLSIRPNSLGALINFEYSSSQIDDEETFNYWPMLTFGGADAYIGRGDNLSGFGTPTNGLKFFADHLTRLGNLSTDATNYITIHDAADQSQKITYTSPIHSFQSSSNCLQLTITSASISSPLPLSIQSHITASGNISASGNLFISASTTASTLNTLMYDIVTGQVYYTGSYGGGGGTGTVDEIAGFIAHTGDTNTKFGFPSDDTFEIWTSNLARVQVASNGTLHAAGDIIAYSTTPSDQRLKHNIYNITSSLSKVCELQAVQYDWKYRDEKSQVGLIAQDVEKIFPGIIKESELPFFANNNNMYKTIQYEQLVPHLIESIKELKSEIDDLKSKLKG